VSTSTRLRPVATFARITLRERFSRTIPVGSPEHHLLEAERWLCRAQDATTDGGVSYGYSVRGGWRPSYPETSGYIATTFLRLAVKRDAGYADRASRILHWLLTVQNADGSFANQRFGREGIVFDTGQILFALVRGYEALKWPELLESARTAAQWLTQIADSRLRWTRNEHLGVPHVYNTRTAWALLRMNQVEFEAAREAVARSNLDWALEMQRSNGLFEHCSFKPGQAPVTHTIAYAAQGLLECGFMLKDQRYIDAAIRCAYAVLGHLEGDGHLPSSISPSGRSRSSSCCLTGNCQFAIVWARLHALTNRSAYRTAAKRALNYVMATQDIHTTDENVRGGIKGSHPVWGHYAFMCFPNWAAKFFIDAMWLRKELEQ
jgi:hypothetical protein